MPILTRSALAFLVLTGAVVGAWASAFPHGFYTSFPGLGRAWVSVDGPFNEHLVRDTGDAYLMIGTLAGLCAWRQALVSPFAVGGATLVFNVLHLAYHTGHLGMLPLSDRVLNVVVLGASVLASVWLLTPAAAGRASRRFAA